MYRYVCVCEYAYTYTYIHQIDSHQKLLPNGYSQLHTYEIYMLYMGIYISHMMYICIYMYIRVCVRVYTCIFSLLSHTLHK